MLVRTTEATDTGEIESKSSQPLPQNQQLPIAVEQTYGTVRICMGRLRFRVCSSLSFPIARNASRFQKLIPLPVENDSFNAQPEAPACPGPATKKAGASGWALNEQMCHSSPVGVYVFDYLSRRRRKPDANPGIAIRDRRNVTPSDPKRRGEPVICEKVMVTRSRSRAGGRGGRYPLCHEALGPHLTQITPGDAGKTRLSARLRSPGPTNMAWIGETYAEISDFAKFSRKIPYGSCESHGL